MGHTMCGVGVRHGLVGLTAVVVVFGGAAACSVRHSTHATIDVDAASERGISVANCPGKNSIAVAELAFALILALSGRTIFFLQTIHPRIQSRSHHPSRREL